MLMVYRTGVFDWLGGRPSLRLALTILTALLLVGNSRIQADVAIKPVGEVRTLHPSEWGINHPAGLAYSAKHNLFFLRGEDPLAEPAAEQTTIVVFTAYEDLIDIVHLPVATADAINITFDDTESRLFLLNPELTELIQVKVDNSGALDRTTVTHFPIGIINLTSAQGMAVDTRNGLLFILDVTASQIVKVTLQENLEQVQFEKVDLVPELDVAGMRGIALNPASLHLTIIHPGRQLLYELNQAGELVGQYDVANLALVDPLAPVYAPSSDLTDDAAVAHLFIADSHLMDEPAVDGEESQQPLLYRLYLSLISRPQTENVDAGEAVEPGNRQRGLFGKIVEVTLDPLDAVVQAGSLNLITLVQTINTSQFSPPSPDPSGLAYLPHLGTLLIADGEVDEMSQYFTGDNLFEMSLSGNLIKTLTTIPFSDEPVGLDVNPANRHLFVSDDTGTRSVYEVNPGSDGQYDTADDIVTSFSTAAFDSKDPEGLAYDPGGAGTLYILDGVNREVYRVSPGANGLFDGVAPTGDDQVTHFDTLSFGLDDPEGIAFDAATGHLYLVGKPRTTMFEVTTGGVLVQTLDISAANARKPAGLAIAPGSQNAGQASIYLVDRGVDNDSDPNENDGKVYEFSLGQPVQTPTSTRTPTNTPATGPSPTSTNTSTPTNTPTRTNTPTITPTPTDTPVTTGLTLAAVADARVLQDNPDTNYGSISRLYVDSPSEQSYIRFAVSGVNGAVQSAVLRLFVTNGSSNGPSLRATDNSWSESGITWNNRPAATGGVIADVGAIAADSWAEYNVTAQVTGNGVYNFVLLPDSTDGVTFYSREGGTPPQLVLAFATGPTPTPTNTPTQGPTSTPTNTPTPGPSPTPTDASGSGDLIFVSSTSSGNVGGIPFADEDILVYDTGAGSWAIYFDGSDVLPTSVDVDGFFLLDDGSFLLSFTAEDSVSGLGLVDDSDLVRFIPTSVGPITAGTWEWYFDGSDVELTANAEDIDAIAMLGDGRLVFSTLGNVSVSGVSGQDIDLVAFAPTQLGETTSGVWNLYFRGSNVGLSPDSTEDILGAWIDPANGDIYLTTAGSFTVPGVGGDGGDIFGCTPGATGASTSCTFWPYWDGSTHGFGDEVVNAFFIDRDAQQVSAASRMDMLQVEHTGEGDDPNADPDEGPDDLAGPEQDQQIFLPLISGTK